MKNTRLLKQLVNRVNTELELYSELTKAQGKTLNKWLERVIDIVTPWSEQEIISFRKYVGSSGCKCEKAKSILLSLFNETLEVLADDYEKGYRITDSQSEKGIEYIYNTVFKKNGQRRNTKYMPFNDREAEIIKDFRDFMFVGIHNGSQNSYRFYTPIYRVYNSEGEWFDYTTDMGIMQVL